ncbi:G2/mitotic-specific cyclin [Monascus purpureus]|uniref:G2/mitotic-specific cyclin n=1 Tax=Monascus purpureus TaxID=5098 RepID=A0A507QYN7_MONPU|nr:G2/mitotic-specific cyclin [Monascus purpureus]BDD58455.1 hypothetical protein MAP00_003734 [Monascus purpureus]
MPPARGVRSRGVTNENDENGPTTRLTRAKAAALSGADAGATKKPLQTKKAASNISTAGTHRKRAALGDVSNVTKTENGETKDVKKPTAKASASTKATTQTSGVQKITRTNSSRTALGSKDQNAKKPAPETKRPGSGVKRSSSQKSIVAETLQEEEPPRKRVDLQKAAPVKSSTSTSQKQEQESVAEPEDEEGHDYVMNLDEEDLDDPLMAAEYVVEIFDYLRQLELETMPNPDYIEHQPDLEWKMRGILVDWLIEVHTNFRLLPETLFLAVNIIDRFLSAEVVALDRLQLVGVTAMFIASKYEEVLSPHVVNFSRVADDTFSEKEILDAERHVLATLEYNMSYPNPMNFLRRISKADNYDIETRTLGKYLMEISLLDHRFMCYAQSHVAAAAMYLARVILGRGPWDATLAHYAGYTEEDILPVVTLMVDYLHRPVCHEAFFRKYSSKKFLKASILIRHWAKKYHHLYIDSRVASHSHKDNDL